MAEDKQVKNVYDELDSFNDNDASIGIKQDQTLDLKAELNKFNLWLIDYKVIIDVFDIENVKIEPFSSEDWIMRVNKYEGGKKIVSFNPNIIKKCNFEYLKIVLLHEYFHLIVQKVPNKIDAVKIKDTFGGDFMNLIDIEADFYVALYLRKSKNYTLEKYWELYFNGSKIFSDEWIRTKKFERYIGSLLSVNKMFSEDLENISFDLFLPTIASIYTEESIMILVVKQKHISFEEVDANYEDFKKIKDIYKNNTDLDFKNYFKEIKAFTTKALKLNHYGKFN
ncbi:hypothetical protein SY27_10980 [Flavobacterium sp. 316]|uniref:hypothetical protein n=1 Tax=Flavobacterium sp. 316 TaxID=1603293 RepID=UPI0005DF0EA9|nr:hypothetical protein [Flavobacterium sp. 316]KIX21262.1 hypothetical protein SY27_10980 [Flavobacterium sp. 316]